METVKENKALQVALPVGLSLLLLIIIITTAVYLKRYWMEKLNESKVEPVEHALGNAASLPGAREAD